MRLVAATASFVVALKDERLAAHHTVALYRRTVDAFAADIGDVPLSQVRREHVRAFLVRLRDVHGNGASSLRTKMAALRAFFTFLVDRRLLRAAPFKVEDFRIRVPRRMATVLTQEEFDRFLSAVERSCTTSSRSPRGRARGLPVGLRDRALFFLLAGCGLRVAEATNTNLADVSRLRKAIHVRGKGGVEREVFYDVDPLERYLVEYMDARLRLDVVHDALFINHREGGRLTPRAVQLRMRRYLRDADVSKGATPHSLRHTFATLAIERGANVKAVAQILGHRQVSTTINTYTHLSETHVRDVFRMCHPLQEGKLPLDERVAARKRSLPLLS